MIRLKDIPDRPPAGEAGALLAVLRRHADPEGYVEATPALYKAIAEALGVPVSEAALAWDVFAAHRLSKS
jgi:hypothetical protein